MGFFYKLLDLIFPKQCLHCYKFGNYLCSRCRNKFLQYYEIYTCHVCKCPLLAKDRYVHESCKHRSNLNEVVVCVHYNQLVQKIISVVKYDGYYDVINLILELMLNYIDISKFNNSIFVPVPLNKFKQNQRGFNQAELISKKLTKLIKKDCVGVNLLIRTKNTKTQVGMTKEERASNLNSAFDLNYRVNNLENLRNKTVWIVDDIMTTGSTLEKCAEILKTHGFYNIKALVFARG